MPNAIWSTVALTAKNGIIPSGANEFTNRRGIFHKCIPVTSGRNFFIPYTKSVCHHR